MATVVVERAVVCRAEKSLLWCAVADTERMNRAIGLGPIAMKPLSGDGSARFMVSTVSGGFPLEYEERPFEFTENERFVIHRNVTKGMVRSLHHEFTLESRDDGGTTIHVRISVETQNALLVPIVRLQVGRFAAKIERELRKVDEDALAGRTACFRDTRSELSQEALQRARDKLMELLPAERRSCGERLVEFVAERGDADVARIRPFELADEFGLEPRAMLAACLSGVQAGLLELSWDLVCPSCRTASDRIDALAELPSTGHCQLCDISYELEFDRAVEATFQPSKAIRVGLTGPFCVGGPRAMPHVVAQGIVGPRGETRLTAPREEGRYRLFVRGGASGTVEVAAGGARQARVAVGEGDVEPALVTLAPGGEIVVSQDLPLERHVKLERLDWASRAATAHALSTLPEFRRAFGADVLKSGARLKVARVALLFTDLTGSTALYDRTGDATAFQLIHDHFALLGRVVSEHHGTIVKTIGDAVMAAFIDEGNAVKAAVAMHRALPEFRRGRPDAEALYLRIGVHAGPCYVVTANGILDYFGQTVNVAARLQGIADAGELVMAGEALDHACNQGWLESCPKPEPFRARLKGVAQELPLARVAVDVTLAK